jgi:hypothetical protein
MRTPCPAPDFFSFSVCQCVSFCLFEFQHVSISAFQHLICRFLLSAFPISAFDWPLSACQHVSMSGFQPELASRS